jgi:hypothetical protein
MARRAADQVTSSRPTVTVAGRRRTKLCGTVSLPFGLLRLARSTPLRAWFGDFGDCRLDAPFLFGLGWFSVLRMRIALDHAASSLSLLLVIYFVEEAIILGRHLEFQVQAGATAAMGSSRYWR